MNSKRDRQFFIIRERMREKRAHEKGMREEMKGRYNIIITPYNYRNMFLKPVLKFGT